MSGKMRSRDSPSLKQQQVAAPISSRSLKSAVARAVGPFSSPGVHAEGTAEEGASQELSTCLPTLWHPRAVSPF